MISISLIIVLKAVVFWVRSFGLVKSYTMPRPVESASLFPSRGKFIAGGDDMWVRLFDFDTGDEIGEFPHS